MVTNSAEGDASDVEIHIPESEEDETSRENRQQPEPSQVIEIKLPENSQVTPLVKIPTVRYIDGKSQSMSASFIPSVETFGDAAVNVVMTEVPKLSPGPSKTTQLVVTKTPVPSPTKPQKSVSKPVKSIPLVSTPRIVRVTRPVVRTPVASPVSSPQKTVVSSPQKTVVKPTEKKAVQPEATSTVTTNKVVAKQMKSEPTSPSVKTPQPKKGNHFCYTCFA